MTAERTYGRNQCQWTIEIRAHCDDAERQALTETISRLARHADATVKLLPNAGAMVPEVVAYGDDFFVGHFDVGLLQDTIGEAIASHDLGKDEGVSDELLQAARDMAHDKSA